MRTSPGDTGRGRGEGLSKHRTPGRGKEGMTAFGTEFWLGTLFRFRLFRCHFSMCHTSDSGSIFGDFQPFLKFDRVDGCYFFFVVVRGSKTTTILNNEQKIENRPVCVCVCEEQLQNFGFIFDFFRVCTVSFFSILWTFFATERTVTIFWWDILQRKVFDNIFIIFFRVSPTIYLQFTKYFGIFCSNIH